MPEIVTHPEPQPDGLCVVILRVPRPMLEKIDAFGCDRYLHRSEKIRRLISRGLGRDEV
jgi:hypothetical protein